MLDGTLGTTNILLGIMAAVSVLEIIALAVVVVVTMRMYAKALEAIGDVQRQLTPLAQRANQIATVMEGVATDVRGVTTRAASGAEGAGRAFQTAFDVVAFARGTSSVASRALPLLGIVRGLGAAYRSFNARRPPRPAPTSAGRPPQDISPTDESALDPPINDGTEVVHGA